MDRLRASVSGSRSPAPSLAAGGQMPELRTCGAAPSLHTCGATPSAGRPQQVREVPLLPNDANARMGWSASFSNNHRSQQSRWNGFRFNV